MGTDVTMKRIAEASPGLKARIAGVFYLLTILMGVVVLFARGRLGLAGDLIDLIAGACYMAVTRLLVIGVSHAPQRAGPMGAGIFGVAMAAWLPAVKAAYDPRKSVAETLSATIASSGVEQAAKQYHDLKAAEPTTYNFDEDELNNLGYRLIRSKKSQEAIRILPLNVEAYPQSSNVYDSLGEAYMDGGNTSQAIANYQKSLQLNPKNRGAVQKLQKLNAP